MARSTHRFISRRLYFPLQRARNFRKSARRPVMLAFYAGMEFRRTTTHWSTEQKREWILRRLHFSLRRAYRETDFYRERFDHIGFDPFTDFSFADFARLPALEKDDLFQAGKTILSKAIPKEKLLHDSTGGSTGKPVEIWLGAEEQGWRESAGERFQEQIGAPAGTRTALLWGHHLDPVKRDSLRDRFIAFLNHQRWFDCFRLAQDTLEKYHLEFQRWQPELIIAYAAPLGALAEWVAEHHLKPNYPEIGFVTGAEKLLPHHRAIIESVFRRPVHERYGSRDVGYIGYQLNPQQSTSFALDWANLLIEPESTETVSSILITKLHADGMPMIRYRIGDLGHFPVASAPGNPSFTLNEIIGRETDRIWLRSGRWISGSQIPHMMKDAAVQEYQLVQQADYSIHLSIVPKREFNEAISSRIQSTLGLNLEGLPIDIVVVDHIERTKANKFRPVISHVKPLEQIAS
ncbi:MAG: hypothetical protein AB1757_10725 [Acidobacteriota bacterium]